MKNLFLIFFGLFLFDSYAQYEAMDYKSFFQLDSLDSTITLDENFDYNLVNVGVMYHTNKHRINKKRSVLTYNSILEQWAGLHSMEMKKHRFFAHINRRNRVLRDIDDRANFVGYDNYKELAENIYYGFVDQRRLPTYRELIETITVAFIKSKPHNENLLNTRVEEMGGFIVFEDEVKDGFLHYYFTQSFGSQFK